MKSAVFYLRLAAIISLVFGIGHSLGGTEYWSPMGDNVVLQAMKLVHFNVMGASRSYLDFYMGFGWSLGVAQFVQSAVLWQLGTIAKSNASAVRPIVIIFALGVLAGAIIAWKFLFILPLIFSCVLLGGLLAAIYFIR